MTNETIKYTVALMDPAAKDKTPGWYARLDGSKELIGPFDEESDAHGAVEKLIEEALAESLAQALFGEAA